MLRSLTLIALAAALGGCAVVPPAAWNFNPTQPRPAADPAQVAPLTNQIAQLQGELNEVRAQIAVQPDAPHRLPLYSREDRIGRELSPLQRELAQYGQAR